jgi:hypothetical protein
MSYSQGGLIQASDYNNIVGSNSTTAGTINYIWSTGNGQYGYGQTALSTVSQAGLVSATQWATAISRLNSISAHQTTTLNITQPSAGGLVQYLSSVTSGVTQVNNNRLSFSSTGVTATGAVFTGTATQATQGAVYGPSLYATRTATFTSGDAARYFFNAGGSFNLVITGVTNNDGTARSTDAVNTIGTYLAGVSNIAAITNGGRTGTGGTATTNTTTTGYYGLTGTFATTQQITTSSSTYGGDYAYIQLKTNGLQGSNADNGSIVSIGLGYYGAVHSGSFNDTLGVTVSHRVDVVYPETTNLTANTWGAVVIA